MDGCSAIKISVIIPVYCAAGTLRMCLDSVLNQSFRKLEVICVDDGSTDSSLAILQEYTERDQRVRVLTQENQFAGTARNRGMESAVGKYVAFLDADDSYLPGVLEVMYRYAEEQRLDMLKTSFLCEDVSTGEQYETLYSQNSDLDVSLHGKVLRFIPSTKQLLSVADVPWNGLYRLNFLRENQIVFNHLRCVNDHSFFIHCLLKAERVMVIDERAVCYRVGQEGSLVGRRGDYFINQIESYRIVRNLCEAEENSIRKTVMGHELNNIFSWYCRLKEQAADPAAIESQMKNFVATIDEEDMGRYFVNSFYYRDDYDRLRHGREVKPLCRIVIRIIHFVREYGLICAVKKVLFGKRRRGGR